MELVRRRILYNARFAALYLAIFASSIAGSLAQLGTPPIITVPPLNLSVLNGGKLVLTTTAISLTAATFNWRLNGQILSNADVVNLVVPLVGTVSTLTISNVTPAYAGQYSAQALNAVGSATSGNALVSVLGGVVVDQVSSAKTNANTLQWSHTVGNGENRILLVTTAHRDAKKSVVSVTYGGVALTKVGFQDGDSDEISCSIWKLPAPAPGTAAVVVTLSGSQRIAAGALSFFGVDQANPLGNFTSAKDNAAPVSVATSASTGQMIVDVLAAKGDATSVSPGSGQFQKWNLQTGTGSGEVIGASSIKSGAQNTSTTWNLSREKPWTLAAVALKPTGMIPLSLISSGAGLGLNVNGFTLKLSGPSGSTFVVEASADLKTWRPISTNSAPGGIVSCTDTAAVNLPFRYYRLKTP